ncbi:MAG: YicC family protein [Planctomycetota bacterium]|nr:MAG: YicC family protein [Planctomycetota bacterium]
MTGQGQGRQLLGSATIAIEIRSVNHRHLKLQTRAADGLQGVEPAVEARVRQAVRRGALQINIGLSGLLPGLSASVDEGALSRYVSQLTSAAEHLRLQPPQKITELLDLPGVIPDPRNTVMVGVAPETKEAVLQALEQALASFNQMRLVEGQHIANELQQQLDNLRELLDKVESRAPIVVHEYRERLAKKLADYLGENGAEVEASDLLREVLLFADRSDIREEIVRMRSHLAQFEQLFDAPESQGRKMDFLVQELFRETNTIGAKANDAQIAQYVVDMKTVIEQMREQIQNVE